MAADPTEQLAQQEPLGLVDLVAKVIGRELVRLIDHDQVPLALPELVLQVLAAGQLVQAGDQQVVFLEGVDAGGLVHLAGEDGELDAELLVELVLPLLRQAAGGHDQHAPGVGAHQQFANEEPGHDGLAGAGVVGEHIAQGLAREHGLVDRGDLVRQGLHVGGMHRHHGVEEVGEADAPGLQAQFEAGGRGVEGPRAARLGEAEAGFVAAEEHLLADAPVRRLVIDGQGIRAHRLAGDDTHDAVGVQALDLRVLIEVFELEHGSVLNASLTFGYMPCR